MVAPGQTVGSYRILRKLGEGGMGEVFEGLQETIERHVAIKVLHPEYAQQPEYIARFFNEARAVNRIAHPGLVQVSESGQLPDKTAYIVMEFLKGESLGERLKSRGGPLELGQVLNLSCQLADSLAAAHEKGIVHRDLKPDNVMVVADSQMPGGERTKLLDFGIAKLVDEGSPAEIRTRTHAMMGTAYYMSPEQCKGSGKVDDRADVYSFGVMMYEMLSGVRPFTGEGTGDIVAKQIMSEPEPLRSKAPSLPEPVAELVHRMLRKDRGQRPSMAEVTAELESLRQLAPVTSPRRSSAAMPIATGPASARRGTVTAAGESGWLPQRRRSAVVLALVAGVLVSLGTTATVLRLRSTSTKLPTQPAISQPGAASPPANKALQSAAGAAAVSLPAAPAASRPADAATTVDDAASKPSKSAKTKGGKRAKKGEAPSAAPSKPALSPATPKGPTPSKRALEE